MKLTRIRLEQLKKFHQAIELKDLRPGLNLIVGPNESGKSTLAGAIRSAFFERYRSVAAGALRPLGDSSAAPTIDIDFRIGETDYHLHKRYLSRARCELSTSEQRYEGNEAEDHLAGLLGYEYARSGASQARHQGIPGLLWMEQGQTQALGSVVEHAIEHIRSALGNESSQASDEADNIISTVQDMRNALLTRSTGSPRGQYAEALRTVENLSNEQQRLQVEVETYRSSVDRLANLKREHDTSSADRPWEKLRQQQYKAEQQLDETNKLTTELEQKTLAQNELQSRAALLHDRLQALVQQEQHLTLRTTAVQQTQAALQSALAQESLLQQQQAQAQLQARESNDAQQALHRQLEALQRKEQRQTLIERSTQWTRQLEQTQDTQEKLTRHNADLAKVALPPEVLTRLSLLYAKRRELEIRRATMATRLAFTLQPNTQIRLGEQEILGSGEHLLTQATTLSIANIGEFIITPGGDDLASLQQEDTGLSQEINALLSKHELKDITHAQEQQAAAQHLQTEITLLQRHLVQQAPDGIQHLHNQLDQLNTQLQALPAQDEELADFSNATEARLALQTAENAHKRYASLLDTAKQQWHQAQLNCSRAQVHAETAQQEYAKAQTLLQGAERQEQQQSYQLQLNEIKQSLALLQQATQALQARIKDARLDILEQDIARYQLSANQQEQAHNHRTEQLLRLEVELQTLGARGLDEALADTQQLLQQAKRRANELEHRARTLNFLLERLTFHRKQATQALLAPLQTHMMRYLRLLFPDASLTLTEQLTPDSIQRPGPNGVQSELLDLLSHGAKEQLGIIGRLAYADLLKEAGRPTLILLDDALVHTDSSRLDQMKRALFDAATRHQILLFSCHPDAWTDMGVLAHEMTNLSVQ